MLNPQDFLASMQKKAEELIRNSPQLHDIKNNMQGVVHQTLERMNLVTREEFDRQMAVLARTREKIEQLEKTVAELEKKHLNS